MMQSQPTVVRPETDTAAIALPSRGVITVGGPDAREFLQGLISNDMRLAAPDRALWAAMLTPQGKFRHDFFLVERDGGFLIDCEADRLMELGRTLSKYKLRADVTLGIGKEWGVSAVIGDRAASLFGLQSRPGMARALEEGMVLVDPRHSAMGLRLMLPGPAAPVLMAHGVSDGRFEDYEALRIALGLPDGARDMELDKALLLENGFQELGGVAWDKGCWMGQELTARTKYRGLIKKRLLPVTFAGSAPAPGTIITVNGREAGEMRSGIEGRGLALIRLERLAEAGTQPLLADGRELAVSVPDWAVLDRDGAAS